MGGPARLSAVLFGRGFQLRFCACARYWDERLHECVTACLTDRDAGHHLRERDRPFGALAAGEGVGPCSRQVKRFLKPVRKVTWSPDCIATSGPGSWFRATVSPMANTPHR